MRKPIAEGDITSGFGMRFHPILALFADAHRRRLGRADRHADLCGRQWRVIKAGWDSGYGRRVEIQHANGYVTTYNHMSGFGRGIADGARVTQGQVVGYLGQTGLATGPHLHYEVIVNGHFVDPMGIKLARTREFDGKLLAAFKRERDRIDQIRLLRRPPPTRSPWRSPPAGVDRQAQLNATSKAAAPLAEAAARRECVRGHAVRPKATKRGGTAAFRQLGARAPSTRR